MTGIIFLYLEPYNQDEFVRFHARQSIGFSVAWFAVNVVFGVFITVLPHQMGGLLGFIEGLVNLRLRGVLDLPDVQGVLRRALSDSGTLQDHRSGGRAPASDYFATRSLLASALPSSASGSRRNRLDVRDSIDDQLQARLARDRVEQPARYFIGSLHRVARFRGIANRNMQTILAQLQARLRLGRIDPHVERLLGLDVLALNGFAVAREHLIDSLEQALLGEPVIAVRRQRERDLVPDKIGSRNLLEEVSGRLKHDRIREHHHSSGRLAIVPSLPPSSISESLTSPISITSPVTPETCTRSPTLMPNFPIRKK